LIERQKDFLFPPVLAVPRDALLVATVGELLWEQHEAKQKAKTSGDPWSPWHARDGWRMNLSAARMVGFRDGDSLIEAQVRYQRDQWAITINGETTLGARQEA
jgi:3-methylcrotonyl-CoA carboxylase alpha subunit